MKGEISEERTERSALITGNAQRRVSFNDKKKPALDEETNGMTDEKKAAFDEETNGMMAQSPEGLTRVERRGENAKIGILNKGRIGILKNQTPAVGPRCNEVQLRRACSAPSRQPHADTDDISRATRHGVGALTSAA
jgi:hypothetical protein